jgi:hypothetical protein
MQNGKDFTEAVRHNLSHKQLFVCRMGICFDTAGYMQVGVLSLDRKSIPEPQVDTCMQKETQTGVLVGF